MITIPLGVQIMKTLFIAIVALAALSSCEDENYIKPDLYSGRYAYESPDFEFTFTLTRQYGIYQGEGGRVTHPAISATEGRDCQVFTYNRTESGYQQITIRSYGEITWEVNLIGVTFTKEGMDVSEIRAEFPNAPELVLTDQSLEK